MLLHMLIRKSLIHHKQYAWKKLMQLQNNDKLFLISLGTRKTMSTTDPPQPNAGESDLRKRFPSAQTIKHKVKADLVHYRDASNQRINKMWGDAYDFYETFSHMDDVLKAHEKVDMISVSVKKNNKYLSVIKCYQT